MNIQYTSPDYPILPAEQTMLRRRQVYRRRQLGMLLIVLGSVWLWLRLIGWVADFSLGWEQAAGPALAHLIAADLALSAPRVACGMLLLYTIRREQ